MAPEQTPGALAKGARHLTPVEAIQGPGPRLPDLHDRALSGPGRGHGRHLLRYPGDQVSASEEQTARPAVLFDGELYRAALAVSFPGRVSRPARSGEVSGAEGRTG